MQIADLAAAGGVELRRKSSRVAFRDRFRLMLAREFPDWRTEEVSSDANLEQSLSPSYVRRVSLPRLGCGFIRDCCYRRSAGYCRLLRRSCPFGLIWLDYLRRRGRGPAG